MALTSVYYDGPVTESDRAENRTGAPDYGVYGADDFKVTAHPSIPYAVLVKAGRAHGHGVTDEAEIDQVVQCASITSGTRWDLIVVRRNWQPALGGPSTLEVLQAGTAAAIPATRKVGPGVEDDQPLFLVKWQGGTSAPVDFIDLRVWAGNGGMFAKSDLVRAFMDRIGTRIWIDGKDWVRRLGANDTPEWVRSVDAAVPNTTPGWSLNGSLVRTSAVSGSQVSGAFMCTYSGGAFTIGQTFIRALTLTNTGYLPTADVFGYILILSAANVVKADGAFNINPAGELYIRMFNGSYTIQPTDKFYISANWNA